MNNYYKPSGSFAPVSIILLLITLITIVPLTSWLYSLAIHYIPLIYILFLITLGFGFAIGMSVSSLTIAKGKNRNPKLALLFGFIAGLMALYIHWAIWVSMVFNDQVFNFDAIKNLLLNPSSLFALIGQINEYGTWGIKSTEVKGAFLYVIWAIEAIIVLFLAAFIPFGRAGEPFSEQDDEWYESVELAPFDYIENPAQLTSDLEQGNPASLIALNKAGDMNSSHSIFTLYSSQRDDFYITVVNKVAKISDKGEVDHDDKQIFEYLRIDLATKNSITQ